MTHRTARGKTDGHAGHQARGAERRTSDACRRGRWSSQDPTWLAFRSVHAVNVSQGGMGSRWDRTPASPVDRHHPDPANGKRVHLPGEVAHLGGDGSGDIGVRSTACRPRSRKSWTATSPSCARAARRRGEPPRAAASLGRAHQKEELMAAPTPRKFGRGLDSSNGAGPRLAAAPTVATGGDADRRGGWSRCAAPISRWSKAPAPGGAPSALVATRVPVAPGRAEARLAVPKRLPRAVPASCAPTSSIAGARRVRCRRRAAAEWSSRVPLFNLKGKAWIAPRADGVD